MDDANDEEIRTRLVSVPAIEIIRKLKNKIDRQNFCRENSKNYLFNFRLVYPYKWARLWHNFHFASYEGPKKSNI